MKRIEKEKLINVLNEIHTILSSRLGISPEELKDEQGQLVLYLGVFEHTNDSFYDEPESE